MRILFITGSYPSMVCGVGDYAATLAAEIAKQGKVSVGVLTSTEAEHSKVGESDGVQLLPIVHGWRFLEIPKVISAIRNWRPDVVHIQYPTLGYKKSWMPYYLPILLKVFGLTVVQTWHEPPTRFRFFPNALTKDILIGVEPDYLQHIRSRYKWFVRRKETHFIPIGSNIPRAELTETERAEIREQYVGPGRAMVAFFGFVYPTKSVETLFEIADPNRDTIVLITHLDAHKDPYHKTIIECINNGVWAKKAVITGFLSAEEVAKVLCAADAAIFPFKNGVGMRNGSFLAARVQGTFTITTSKVKQGYDHSENVYYASPGDNEVMRCALSEYEGRREEKGNRESFDWAKIADEHVSLYRDIVAGARDSE